MGRIGRKDMVREDTEMGANTLGEMRISEFGKLAQLVYAQSGIRLERQKLELLQSRLRKRMKALSLVSFRDYYQLVVSDGTGEELGRMLDAVTTNKTGFFREEKHFILLAQKLLPGLLQEASRRADKTLRIWSAACSSGEEAYSLAMTALEAAADSGVQVKVLATDLSSRMIQRGLEGSYEREKMKKMSPGLLQKYFEREPDGFEGVHRAGEALRRTVHFRRFNLNAGGFPFRNPFDVIFCRNVMIYFDRAVQENLVGRMAGVLRKGGCLFTGLAESLLAVKHPLHQVAASVYVKP
jgi:chemotaxis protein methyltransferase CheR